MKRVYKSLALFICFLMVASIVCFAEGSLISTGAYDEFTDIAEQHALLAADFEENFIKEVENLSPEVMLFLTALAHDVDVVGSKLLGIQTMLSMELTHYKDGHSNPLIVEKLLKPFIVITISEIHDYLKDKDVLRNINNKSLKISVEKCYEQLYKDKDILTKILQELGQ